MSLAARACLLLVCWSGVWWPAVLLAQTASPIEVYLRLPGEKYSLRDTVQVELAIVNTSQTDRVILRGKPGFHADNGVTLTARDANGTWTDYRRASDGVSNPDARRQER